MIPSLSRDKLVELLYLLMRDACPSGEVVRIIRMVKTSIDEDTTPVFTSKELQAYAERLAGELLP